MHTLAPAENGMNASLLYSPRKRLGRNSYGSGQYFAVTYHHMDADLVMLIRTILVHCIDHSYQYCPFRNWEGFARIRWDGTILRCFLPDEGHLTAIACVKYPEKVAETKLTGGKRRRVS